MLVNVPEVQARSAESSATTTGEACGQARPSAPDVVCALCLESVKDPITTPCGHTFCSGRAGECEGLRKMAELSTHSAKCPQCRADIFSLLVERFPEQIQTHHHDEYASDDEYDPVAEAQWRYERFRAPPSPLSGAFGDGTWQRYFLIQGAFRVHAQPDDHFVWLPTRLVTSWQVSERERVHQNGGSNRAQWFGVLNLASRLHERFHPVYGCWRSELRPGGAFYVAALQQIQWQCRTQVLVESEVYAFTYDAIMHEEVPVPCNVSSWPRSDRVSQMYFVYDPREDCLAFSHSDYPLYSGPGYQPLYQPLCDHSYGQVPDSRAAGPFWMAGP